MTGQQRPVHRGVFMALALLVTAETIALAVWFIVAALASTSPTSGAAAAAFTTVAAVVLGAIWRDILRDMTLRRPR